MKAKKPSVNFSLWSGSSPEDLVVLRQGVKALKNWPIRLNYSKSDIKSALTAESCARYFLAGNDKQRAQSLVKLIKNKNTKEILCSRGGYGNLRILPLLDKMQITPSGKKRIWGYSDTTVIQHYLHWRFGWSWVHSPMLCSHSFIDPTRKEKIALNNMFTNKDMEDHRSMKIVNLGSHKKGSYKRLLLGGNLMSLVSMLTSKWAPISKQKFYLFIEDIGEAPYRLDRLLQMLSYSSFFKKCDGIILGHFTACPDHRDILKLWAKENNLLMLSKLDMGHNSPNIPHPMGEEINLKILNKSSATLHFPSIGI